MDIKAFKMDGLGNDFVIIDQRSQNFNLNKDQIIKVCDRSFIGCDQLILIKKNKEIDADVELSLIHISEPTRRRGISCQFNFGIPISVSTKLFPKIFDFSEPEVVKSVISFLPLSFDRRSATHLVPFPQAPDTLPSEL